MEPITLGDFLATHPEMVDGPFVERRTAIKTGQLVNRFITDFAPAVDPERICAYGHSAGGNLAAQLGMRDTRDNSDPALAIFSSRVARVVDLAAEMDLTIPSMVPNGDAIFVLLLGGTREEVPDAYLDLCDHACRRETAPFLIFHGADECSFSSSTYGG